MQREYNHQVDDSDEVQCYSITYGNHVEDIVSRDPISKSTVRGDIMDPINKECIHDGISIVALFRAVIMQALVDISSNSKRT